MRGPRWEPSALGLGMRTAALGPRGWQQAGAEPGRGNALCEHQSAAWRGAVFMLCWQDGHSFTSLQGPQKAVWWEVGRSCWACGFYPSRPLNRHDAALSPIAGWPLGVAAFRPETGAESNGFALSGAAIWRQNTAKPQRGCREPESLQLSAALASGLLSGVPAPQGTDDPTGARWNESDAFHINVHFPSVSCIFYDA